MKKRLFLQGLKGAVTLSVVLSAGGVQAQIEDDCTAKLERYLETLHQNVASEHIAPRQKEASQKLIDKAARLRADKEFIYTDCAVFDKLLF